MKKICFTGGGTAGHISPNLALIPYFLENGYEVHYIGSKNGIEKEMIHPPIIYHEISTGKLRRYFDLKNFTDPFRIIGGFFQSLSVLRKIKPSVVFSKGGFVSVPVCVAAKQLRIPVILHESDYSTGLANKLCTPYCKVICAAFETALAKAGNKGVVTGIPIRQELFSGNKEKAKAMVRGYDETKQTVMFMGGSLGATVINNALRGNLEQVLEKYNIIHICGKGNTESLLTNVKGYAQFEFIEKELADFMALCDFVVSRSGATAIFEFLALNKPMLLIPLPAGSSRGDQLQNADYFEKKGYSKTLLQENLTPTSLLTAMNDISASLEQYKSRQKQDATVNCNDKIIQIILDNMKQG